MQEGLLSITILTYYTSKKLVDLVNKTKCSLEKEKIDYELIIIDDGSNDDTYEIALNLEKENDRIHAYKLSRNYTSWYAVFAGFSVSKGDCAVFITDDGQPSINDIVPMYKKWQLGNKIIFLERNQRVDPLLTKILAQIFYKIMDKMADVKFPRAGLETVLLDREVLDIINKKIHPINTALFPEILRLGFDPVYLNYNRPKSDRKKSWWTLRKKIKLAKNIFYSSSSFPIRFISFIGIMFSIISLILIFFYVYIKIFGEKPFWGEIVPGWTSTVLFISFFSGLILFSLGIIAEYIWRIYEEVKNRPGYIIKKKEDQN